VAPCLLPKISGVEVTPSVTSAESSEQFWCNPGYLQILVMSIKRLSYLSHLYTSVNFNIFKLTGLMNNNIIKH